jgi:hypothetical protein
MTLSAPAPKLTLIEEFEARRRAYEATPAHAEYLARRVREREASCAAWGAFFADSPLKGAQEAAVRIYKEERET